MQEKKIIEIKGNDKYQSTVNATKKESKHSDMQQKKNTNLSRCQ